MLAEPEQIERRTVMQNAFASQRIEGLKPDAKVMRTPKNGRAAK